MPMRLNQQFILTFALCFMFSVPSLYATEIPAVQQESLSDEVVEVEQEQEVEEIQPERSETKEFPYVKLRMLDKITARTMTFDMQVGSTVKFGDIYVKAQTCQEPPPIEKPESSAFLQIWEELPDTTSKWVFSGWMFASSPALSSMDHPIYDVWVLDCLTKENVTGSPETEKEEDGFELP